ncbi:MAG: YfgM family protein [Endozoicomonas sp.]
MNRTDEEEVELLKRLWKEYGQPVVAGLAITMVAVFGYKAYQKNQLETAAAASQLYQNLLETVQLGQTQELSEEQQATVSHVVTTLQDDYAKSSYAAYGTLLLARQQVLANNLEAAQKSLEWILGQKPEREVELITRSRLARVLLGQSGDNAQAALDLLKPATDKSFTATVESVRGDAYLALGQQDQARDAYQKALDAARESGESRPLLQFKLDDLAPAVKEG